MRLIGLGQSHGQRLAFYGIDVNTAAAATAAAGIDDATGVQQQVSKQ